MALLCLAAPVLIGRSLLRRDEAVPSSTPGLAAPELAVPVTAAVPVDEKASAALAEALRLPAAPADHRDPFGARPSTQNLMALSLSAIWTERGATLVVLNDRILRAGDAIGRWQIESATNEGVWISHGQARHFLALGETISVNLADAPPAPAASL